MACHEGPTLFCIGAICTHSTRANIQHKAATLGSASLWSFSYSRCGMNVIPVMVAAGGSEDIQLRPVICSNRKRVPLPIMLYGDIVRLPSAEAQNLTMKQPIKLFQAQSLESSEQRLLRVAATVLGDQVIGVLGLIGTDIGS